MKLFLKVLQGNFWNIHIRRYTFVTCIFSLQVGTSPGSFLCEVCDPVSPATQSLQVHRWTPYYSGKALKKLFYRCANVGASNDLLLPSTPPHFKEIQEILLPCNILTLWAMLPRTYIVPIFYIFLAIQSHTLILLLIALSVYSVVLPQTSWFPISSLSPNFEHPKLKI